MIHASAPITTSVPPSWASPLSGSQTLRVVDTLSLPDIRNSLSHFAFGAEAASEPEASKAEQRGNNDTNNDMKKKPTTPKSCPARLCAEAAAEARSCSPADFTFVQG